MHADAPDPNLVMDLVTILDPTAIRFRGTMAMDECLSFAMHEILQRIVVFMEKESNFVPFVATKLRMNQKNFLW
ncbi:hypothetical protein NECAME_06264 [Necator americanus]|uniref:Uncharacterized protein n=1 Tax=Necator americanus TaxID=51031 RepID=W2TXJ2_NECAM|nr:hypothetical protein NECAME_06264 [Necator americanus]ETN85751.1 hypothetical protein NECAME_06264 [Necator americanus]